MSETNQGNRRGHFVQAPGDSGYVGPYGRLRSDRIRTVPGLPKAEKRRRWAGEPPKQWNPEYAARIPWYPKSPEAFARWTARMRERMKQMHAEGRFPSRRGVLNGYGGRADELVAWREAARAEAKKIVAYMVENNMVVTKDDERAELALETLVTILTTKNQDTGRPLESTSARVAAAKAILDFTKQKPAQRADVNLTRAEDLLAAVAADMAGEPRPEPRPDPEPKRRGRPPGSKNKPKPQPE